MARTYAKVWLDLWADDDFRELSPDEQHLYFVLLTSRSLNHCGVVDWRPRRLAKQARGWSAEDIERAGKGLAERLFLVVDEDTEEALLRSYVRHDGPMRSMKTAVAVAEAWQGVASARLRGVVVHELRRLRVDEPDLRCWQESRGVADVLASAAFDVRAEPGAVLVDAPPHTPADGVSDGVSETPSEALPEAPSEGVPDADGSPIGRGTGWGTAFPEPDPEPLSSPSVGVGGVGEGEAHEPLLTLVPAPASQQAAQPDQAEDGQEKPRKRAAAPQGTRLPEGWLPSPELVAWARKEFPHVDSKLEHEKFVDHFRGKAGKDGRKADWPATWRNWMRRAAEGSGGGRSGRPAVPARRGVPEGW